MKIVFKSISTSVPVKVESFIKQKIHKCGISGVCISVTRKKFKRRSIYQPVANINNIKTITPINSLT